MGGIDLNLMPSTAPLLMVQNNRMERLTRPCAQAARERGFDIWDWSVVKGWETAGVRLGKRHPVFIYGSVGFYRHWLRHHEAKDWVFAHEETMDVREWKSRFRGDFLNASGVLATVDEYIATASLPPCHIRPIASTAKEMVGAVLSRDELAAMQLPGNLPIWVSEPVDIVAEVRIWIIHRKIATASTYRFEGKNMRSADHPVIDAALEFALKHIAYANHMPHFVMDVALTDRGWKVVELNPINSSGWYAADPGVILDAYVAGYRA